MERPSLMTLNQKAGVTTPEMTMYTKRNLRIDGIPIHRICEEAGEVINGHEDYVEGEVGLVDEVLDRHLECLR